jgi:TonB family protein
MKNQPVRLPAELPEQTQAANGPFRSASFDEPPIWTGLFDNLREALFPPHLPPLELTSTPIPAQDRMAGKTNPWAIGTAAAMNAGLLALILLMRLRTTTGHFTDPYLGAIAPTKDFTLVAPSSSNPAHGGGSGGSHSLIDPITGRTPPHVDIPLTPPQVPLIENPLLAAQPAISVPPDVKLPDNPTLQNLGVLNSRNSTQVSFGPGGPAGIGNGPGNGDGPGHGPGYGPGYDGGTYTPGVGGVSKPTVLFAPIAEFSDEARRQKYQGVCIVSIIVDAHGNPQSPRVTRSLGMGLDEKALEAVRKYRFKPAMKDGKPVASYVSVEIDFHLY